MMSITDPRLISHWPVEMLDQLQQRYRAERNDQGVASIDRAFELKGLAAGAVQTQELADSGRLFAHRRVDPDTGRICHSFTGDAAAFLAPFRQGEATGRFDTSLFSGRNSDEGKAAARDHAKVVAAGRAALGRS